MYPDVHLEGSLMRFGACVHEHPVLAGASLLSPSPVGAMASVDVALRYDRAAATLHLTGVVDAQEAAAIDHPTGKDATSDTGNASGSPGGPKKSRAFVVPLGHPRDTCPVLSHVRSTSATHEATVARLAAGGMRVRLAACLVVECTWPAGSAPAAMMMQQHGGKLDDAGRPDQQDHQQRGDASSGAGCSTTTRVLITRRPATMRTFPLRWVLPGGHVELDESLEMAAARETFEETGLVIDPAAIEPFAAWESVYPALIDEGDVSRQHIVVFMRARIT
jgi:8-oxo-dGTP pyrophosphatase MutT (NUDIX family)